MKGSRKGAAVAAAIDVEGRRRLLAGAGLCLLTLAAYSNSFTAAFTQDNRGLLLEDARIREATAANVGLIFQHTYWWPYGESGLYRPLTTLTYLFNYAVLGNGGDAVGYHLLSFLLHAGNVLLVYALGRRLLRGFWPPVLMAALWAVHPVLTESVTNMVGRADLLAGAAVLGGLLLYLRSTEAEGGRRWGWLAALAVVSAAGAFCKESAVTLLGMIVLWELVWWKERRRGPALLLGCLAVAPGIQLLLYQRAAVLAAAGPVHFPFWDNPITAAGFWTGRLTALKVMGLYLGRLAWPASLSSDYSFAQIPLAHGSPGDWLAWSAVGLAAAAAVAMYRRNRSAFYLAGFALATFLPMSNLLFPIGTIMAERFLYLPAMAAAGCFAMAVCGAGERLGRRREAQAVLWAVVAALAVRTWVRNLDWQDDLSLARATVRVSPDSYKSHKMMAMALDQTDPSHGNIAEVAGEASRTVSILDSVPAGRNNADSYRRAAHYYLELGDARQGPEAASAYRKADGWLRQATEIVRASEFSEEIRARMLADLDRDRAALGLRLGDAESAVASARKALAAEPLAAESYAAAAQALVAAGHADEAAVLLMQGVLLTQSAELRDGLVRLYRGGLDREGCALLPGSSALNRQCGMVHRHLCAASAGAIQAAAGVGRADLVENLKASAVRDFGCPTTNREN